MNTKTLAKHYGTFTPDERFRLILAASGRGDVVERDRLTMTGGRIHLSVSDHAPQAMAFHEISTMTYIELQEDCAKYVEELHRRSDDSDTIVKKKPSKGKKDRPEASDEKKPDWLRFLDAALATGYVLKTKAEGWKLFCGRMNVPPFLLWETYPGFDRLRHTLARVEKAAFTAAGFLIWLNSIRPKGQPEATENHITAEMFAANDEAAFRERTEWWNGDR